jgi:hypothetical protein
MVFDQSICHYFNTQRRAIVILAPAPLVMNLSVVELAMRADGSPWGKSPTLPVRRLRALALSLIGTAIARNIHGISIADGRKRTFTSKFSQRNCHDPSFSPSVWSQWDRSSPWISDCPCCNLSRPSPSVPLEDAIRRQSRNFFRARATDSRASGTVLIMSIDPPMRAGKSGPT